jgi:hypothetical protein
LLRLPEYLLVYPLDTGGSNAKKRLFQVTWLVLSDLPFQLTAPGCCLNGLSCFRTDNRNAGSSLQQIGEFALSYTPTPENDATLSG